MPTATRSVTPTGAGNKAVRVLSARDPERLQALSARLATERGHRLRAYLLGATPHIVRLALSEEDVAYIARADATGQDAVIVDQVSGVRFAYWSRPHGPDCDCPGEVTPVLDTPIVLAGAGGTNVIYFPDPDDCTIYNCLDRGVVPPLWVG